MSLLGFSQVCTLVVRTRAREHTFPRDVLHDRWTRPRWWPVCCACAAEGPSMLAPLSCSCAETDSVLSLFWAVPSTQDAMLVGSADAPSGSSRCERGPSLPALPSMRECRIKES